MPIIARKRLVEFWQNHPEAEVLLGAWFAEARRAQWQKFADVKSSFKSVERVGERLIFNIGGNKFRLIALVDFQRRSVLIRFIGSHKQYDRIDAAKI